MDAVHAPVDERAHARPSALRQSVRRGLLVSANWGRGSTYRAWPSSYDVKTQRSALTQENNGHTFSFTFLRTHRGETRWSERDGSTGSTGKALIHLFNRRGALQTEQVKQ